MVLSLVWEVVARYFFNAPTVWAYDMTFMLYGTFFMLGSAYTLHARGHIRTDSLYARWSQRTPGRVGPASATSCSSFPPLAVFSWLGWDFFLEIVRPGERIVTSPWMPVVWPFKFVMPLLPVLLLSAGRLPKRLKTLLCGVDGAMAWTATARRRRRAVGASDDAPSGSSPEWCGIVLAGRSVRRHLHRLSDRVHADRRRAHRSATSCSGPLALHLMTLQFFSVMKDTALASVPFFLFMGYLLEQSGLMERLFRGIQLMLARHCAVRSTSRCWSRRRSSPPRPASSARRSRCSA